MLAHSSLLAQLNNHSHTSHGEPLYIYGDPAHTLRTHLDGPCSNTTAELTHCKLVF